MKAMDNKKRKVLEAAGFHVTDAAEWLGLSNEEKAIVDMRIKFAMEIERVCKDRGITQKELAERIGTRQSGVARMLNYPARVTLDSLIRTLLTLGATPRRIAALI
jgi:predicted XRE-type DNA-binding protein